MQIYTECDFALSTAGNKKRYVARRMLTHLR